MQRCESLLGLSLNVDIGSCINDGCHNGGMCLAYTKGVYSYTACRCIAGNMIANYLIFHVAEYAVFSFTCC